MKFTTLGPLSPGCYFGFPVSHAIWFFSLTGSHLSSKMGPLGARGASLRQSSPHLTYAFISSHLTEGLLGFQQSKKKLSPITENTNSTDSFCLTFSCISSFSLSFVFTLFAKLFSLFSNSFSSINSSNRVTCLSRKMYRKIYKPRRYSHKVDLVFILFNRMRKLLFPLGYNPRFLNQNSTQLSRKPLFARSASVSHFPHQV